MSMLDHALDYVARDIPIFPIHHPIGHNGSAICSCTKGAQCGSIGKHPATKNGVYDASSDENVVKGWWRAQSNHNIGIACGAKSFDILDVDLDKGGEESLRDLSYWFEPLPETQTARTGGGGRHILFRHTPGIKNNNHGKLGKGLDFKTTGGYIVAPPSLHKSGGIYSWLPSKATELARLPDWLYDKLADDPSKNPLRNIGKDDEHWIELSKKRTKDHRHKAIISIAGRLLIDARIEPHLAITLILAYNEYNCDPPKDTEEVEKLIKWVAKKSGVEL